MSTPRAQYTVGFLGFPGSGKTSLFQELHKTLPTAGMIKEDERENSFLLTDGDADITVWDLKENIVLFPYKASEALRKTNLIFLVYDITSIASINIYLFLRSIMWLAEADCKVVLLGNKVDQVERDIPFEIAAQIQKKYQLHKHLETSTKKGDSFRLFKECFDAEVIHSDSCVEDDQVLKSI